MLQSTEKEQSDKSNLQKSTSEANKEIFGRTGLIQITNTPFYILEQPSEIYITFKNYKILGPYPKSELGYYEENMIDTVNKILESHHWNITVMVQTIIAEEITREILKETT